MLLREIELRNVGSGSFPLGAMVKMAPKGDCLWVAVPWGPSQRAARLYVRSVGPSPYA